MTWTAALPMRKPAARTRRAVSSSIAVPEAPAHSGSDVPKFDPRSPSPAAESSASHSACAATSPSEWPSSPCGSSGQAEPGQVQGYAVGVPVHVDAQPDPGQGARCWRSLTGRIMPRPVPWTARNE